MTYHHVRSNAAMTLQPHSTLLYHTLTTIGCAIGLISREYDVLINANNVFYDRYELECEFDSGALSITTNTTNTIGTSCATREATFDFTKLCARLCGQLEFGDLINANNFLHDEFELQCGFGCDESTSPATDTSDLIFGERGFENGNANFFEGEFDDLNNKIIGLNNGNFFGRPHCLISRRANASISTLSLSPAVGREEAVPTRGMYIFCCPCF